MIVISVSLSSSFNAFPSKLIIRSCDALLTYHGVLAHQHDALATEALADLVHLLGGDIVDGDDEDTAVLLEEALQLVEVGRLGCGLAPHSV